jgi:uncharacterized protein (TIGR02466 family)
MYLHNIFPTPVGRFHFSQHQQVNEMLVKMANTLEKMHPEGWGHSWADTCGVWNSHCFLDNILELPELATLSAFIDESISEYLGVLCVEHGQSFACQDSWLNIVGPHLFQEYHRHGHSMVSGCYYVQTPPDSGALLLRNSVVPPSDIDSQEAADAMNPYPLQDCARFDPEPGTMIVFPGWADHMVSQNKSQERRISLAFNYALQADNEGEKEHE